MNQQSVAQPVRYDTHSLILDAAEKRFQQYGYGKTTMAEIAEDVGMSAANLYRYFRNKLDIGEACSNRCMKNQTERLRQVTRQGGALASQRIENFFIENLQLTHEIVSQRPHINEMVELVTSRKPAMVRARVEDIVSLIAEIIAYGNEQGEFAVKDVIETARAVHAAMVLFEVPIFVGLYSLEEYTLQAKALARLLVCGLSRR